MPTSTANATITNHVHHYTQKMSDYLKLAKYARDIISEYCGKDLIQASEFRAKSIESFERKCRKLNDDGTPRYPAPLQHLTDLAGVRIVVYLRDSVDPICAEIRGRFDVIEEIDVGERVYKEGKFGYQSKHMLIRLNQDRSNLDENKNIKDLVCEVQVRTLLQHAWAAIDHKIQYKGGTEIPLDVRKRFSALAGALELADRELQRIEDDSRKVRDKIEKDLVDALVKESIHSSSTENTIKSKGELKNITAARDYIKKGSYSEAVSLYSKKIEMEPTAHTLYLGRAKALFLSGDPTRALEDVDRAISIRPNDATATSLKAIIEHGDAKELEETAQSQPAASFATELQNASASLEQGDGFSAYVQYEELESGGYTRVFARFGKAMACLVEGDVAGCQELAGQIRKIPSTPMAVNLTVMDCVAECMAGQFTSTEIQPIKQAMADFPGFRLESSPVRFMLAGLRKKKLLSEEIILAVEAEVQY